MELGTAGIGGTYVPAGLQPLCQRKTSQPCIPDQLAGQWTPQAPQAPQKLLAETQVAV